MLLTATSSYPHSYSNVAAARRERKQSTWTPALGLLPLVVQVAANVLWISARSSRILVDARTFLPFCCFWGLAFAYNVGVLIVSHVTKAPFPYWNAALVWSVLGALDANLPKSVLEIRFCSSSSEMLVSQR